MATGYSTPARMQMSGNKVQRSACYTDSAGVKMVVFSSQLGLPRSYLNFEQSIALFSIFKIELVPGIIAVPGTLSWIVGGIMVKC